MVDTIWSCKDVACETSTTSSFNAVLNISYSHGHPQPSHNAERGRDDLKAVFLQIQYL